MPRRCRCSRRARRRRPSMSGRWRPCASVDRRPRARTSSSPILQRRSNKKPFQADRSVPDEALASIRSAASATDRVGAANDPKRVAAIKDVARRAFLVESGTDRVLREMVDLTRLDSRAIEASPDGEEVRGPGWTRRWLRASSPLRPCCNPDRLPHLCPGEVPGADRNRSGVHLGLDRRQHEA